MFDCKKQIYVFGEEKHMESTVIVAPGFVNSGVVIDFEKVLRDESTHIIVTDENVSSLYLDKVISIFETAGKKIKSIVVPAGETSKSFGCYVRLVEQSLDFNFDKHSCIISLGGGVVNNLAGFLASTLYRGIGLVHIPTSLLSQVDAAISFKQAINFNHGKNLVGSLYAPKAIIVDPDFLLTLDERYIRDGLAESIKHGLCHDSFLLDYIENNYGVSDKNKFLGYVVSRSIKLKLGVMGGDVVEATSDYNESIKHYGHAVGHAIEHISKGEFYHGEAIAVGMCITAEVALLMGVSDLTTLKKHYDIFQKVGLPNKIPESINASAIVERMCYDKHYLNGKSYLGMVRSIGSMAKIDENRFGHYVDPDLIIEGILNNRNRTF